MNKAEEFALIVESKKTTMSNHIKHFFLIRKYRTSAMLGYTGFNEPPDFANPWLINKLKDEGFIINKKAKNDNGQPCTCVSWIIDDDDNDDDDNDDN